MFPIHTQLRERLQHQLVCYRTADTKMSESSCKWPSVENTLQSGLAIDKQTQVVENQTSLVPILMKKKKKFSFFSLPVFTDANAAICDHWPKSLSGSFRWDWQYLEIYGIIFFILQATLFLYHSLFSFSQTNTMSSCWCFSLIGKDP